MARDDTGRTRRIVDEDDLHRRVTALEMHNAEVFGVDGNNGRYGALEDSFVKHKSDDDEMHDEIAMKHGKLEERMHKIESFQARALWSIGGGVAVAAVVWRLLEGAIPYVFKH